jgi:hypothetical protein
MVPGAIRRASVVNADFAWRRRLIDGYAPGTLDLNRCADTVPVMTMMTPATMLFHTPWLSNGGTNENKNRALRSTSGDALQ